MNSSNLEQLALKGLNCARVFEIVSVYLNISTISNGAKSWSRYATSY